AYEDRSGWNFVGKNVSGSRFQSANLTAANFTNANLTGVNFFQSTLLNADLTGATIQGANRWGTTGKGFTAEQFYSTASYQDGTLSSIDFSFNNLAEPSWNFVGKTLTNSIFSNSQVVSENFLFSDTRG